MSAESRIAARYAKSLVSLAVEQQKLETIKDDIQLFKNTCDDSRPLRLMLKNPVIRGEKKFQVINEIFSKKISPITISFMQIVCKKGRAQFLYGIAAEIIHEYNGLKGIQEASVKTSIPLESKLRDAFIETVAKISGKQPQLTEVVDADIIGGFVLKIGDKQIDSSVKTQLQQLKRTFAGK